jgi:hypothetical protein
MVTPGVLALERRQDITLIKAVARAFRWRRMLETGRFATINELAAAEKINSSYVSRVLRLTLLAPDIVEAILDGRQPEGVTLPTMMKRIDIEWTFQGGMLGSPSTPSEAATERELARDETAVAKFHLGNQELAMPTATARERSRERRWIVLGTDGRYVTLGRGSDPSDEEVRGAEEALRTQGLAGWLAVMEGNPYMGNVPRLMEVRALASPAVPFEDAAAVCIRAMVGRRAESDG